MNANHIRNLAQATQTGSMPFPQIVRELIAEGVEYYCVDYAALRMRFYGTEGGVVVAPLVLELPPIAEAFDIVALKAAIIDSQLHGQHFRDFSSRAVAAGVAEYFAFLRGQRVTYLGRQGDQHVEWFPGTKPTDD